MRARRETLRRQRAVLMKHLSRHLPDWRYGVPEGGLSLRVILPMPVSSALAATTDRFGVRVTTGPRFRTEGVFERHLRVPFTLPEVVFGEALVRSARTYMGLMDRTGEAVARRRLEVTVV